MSKTILSTFLFLTAALVFLVVAAFADRPAIYISLGAVFLILGLAARQRAKKESASVQ